MYWIEMVCGVVEWSFVFEAHTLVYTIMCAHAVGIFITLLLIALKESFLLTCKLTLFIRLSS